MTIQNLIVYTYKNGLATPENLKDELECRRIGSSAADAARAVPDGTLVVNWGYGVSPRWAEGRRVRYLNHPDRVAAKMSKVVQLRKFVEAGVPTFDITTNAQTARRWLGEGDRVLCRHDQGARGSGITVIDQLPAGGRVPVADFYTKWFDKTHEFRVHVFREKIIDVVQKKRLYDAKPLNQMSLTEQTVRNHANGWIEAHKDLHLPGNSRDRLGAAAIAAVRCLGLDFGAVDIVVRFTGPGSRNLDSMAVCEVNTAPGCGAIERAAYVKAIREVYDARV